MNDDILFGSIDAARHEVAANFLIDNFREHVAEVRSDGINADERVLFEAWAIQKLATLWLVSEELIKRIDSLRRPPGQSDN